MPIPLRTIDKINSFIGHSRTRIPPSSSVIDMAVALMHLADSYGINRTNAFLGPEGEIQITFYHQESTLEITFESDDSITIAKDEDDTQLLFKEAVSRSEVYSELRKFYEKICDSPESFIVKIGRRGT